MQEQYKSRVKDLLVMYCRKGSGAQNSPECRPPVSPRQHYEFRGVKNGIKLQGGLLNGLLKWDAVHSKNGPLQPITVHYIPFLGTHLNRFCSPLLD